MGPTKSDYNKRLRTLTVITLSGFHNFTLSNVLPDLEWRLSTYDSGSVESWNRFADWTGLVNLAWSGPRLFNPDRSILGLRLAESKTGFLGSDSVLLGMALDSLGKAPGLLGLAIRFLGKSLGFPGLAIKFLGKSLGLLRFDSRFLGKSLGLPGLASRFLGKSLGLPG